MDESGKLDKDEILEMIEEAAPKQLVSKLTEIVEKCAEQFGKERIVIL